MSQWAALDLELEGFRPEPGHMRRAVEMGYGARELGEAPVGAVVVYEQQIVGEGRNMVHERGDRRAHAEQVAIDEAHRQLGGLGLEGAILYSTHEPCVMCAGTMAVMRMSALVYGTDISMISDMQRLDPNFHWKNNSIPSGMVFFAGHRPDTIIVPNFEVERCLDLLPEETVALYRAARADGSLLRIGQGNDLKS